VLLSLFVLPEGLADAQRRRRRRSKPVPTKPEAPTKGARGEAAPVSTPDPSAGDAREGPSDPEQSELADPGAADGGSGSGANAGSRVSTRGKSKTQVFDFTGLNLSGSERKPQLLYFLDRAREELKRASLERRSFVPEMVRSLDEEAL